MQSGPFESTHKLDFLVAHWISPIDKDLLFKFKIGTCEGLYGVHANSYDIIAILNNQPGNGHFLDVLEWFENSCRRDGKKFRFVAIMNGKFGAHLVKKHGFRWISPDAVEKTFVSSISTQK